MKEASKIEEIAIDDTTNMDNKKVIKFQIKKKAGISKFSKI